jgi:hypothetical protein
MTKKQIAIRKKRPGPSKTAKKPRPNPTPQESDAVRWQHQIGNRALQRALVQRQAAGQPGFKPVDPAAMSAAAQKVIAANEAPIRNWLVANTDRLPLLTIDEVVAQVRRCVAEAGRLSNGEIQNLLQEWASAQNVNLSPVFTLGVVFPALSVQIPDVVKEAFSIRGRRVGGAGWA